MKKTVASFDPDGLLGLKEMELVSDIPESSFGYVQDNMERPMYDGPQQ